MNSYFYGGMCCLQTQCAHHGFGNFLFLGGFLNEKSLCFARCGTTGAFWVCFHYQNNLSSKNRFRCCSQAVGLSEKRLKKKFLAVLTLFFFPSAFGHFKWNPLIISFIWISPSLRSRIPVLPN